MLTFTQFICFSEEKINYNHTNQHWQVRGDDTHHSFKHELSKVILKDAKPYVDHDAHESGKRVYAYLQGNVVKKTPDLSAHRELSVKFNRGDLESPFIHAHDNSPVRKADYVVFDKNKIRAYYK